MKKVIFSMLLLLASIGVFAQNYIRHTVVKDDTVTSLARKYSVTVHDIYTLNNQAKNGIKLGEVILVPINDKNAKFAKTNGTYHTVEPKETLFGIAQKHGVTIQAIQEANQGLLENGLQPSMELLIPTGKKAENTSTITQYDKIVHVVQPKETKFALTQKYGISEEELTTQNPQLKDGLKAGDTLRIAIKQVEDNFEIKSSHKFKDLSKSINTSKQREVVIMLPFNASKINMETKSIQEAIKKDQFLNTVIDVYSGALMAIDKINEIGGNFNITIFDSEETRTSSAIERLIKTHDFSNVDIVIGPFIQTHLEKAASLLESKGVIVISPLSKEGKATYENLYLAVPPTEVAKKMMLYYLQQKNQNTIAIVDFKKNSSREFINQNYPGIQFGKFNEKGKLDVENITTLLQKDKINYVILETESSGVILNTISVLSSLLNSYSIKLVTLDKNSFFESDEIRSQTLANLNLHYPSSIKDISVDETSPFYMEYKEKNNVFPSYAAIKGYDVVLDVLLRLSQKEDFKDLTEKVATEQIESKYIYTKSPDGGYYNTGVYILYYDKDLTIKEAE